MIVIKVDTYLAQKTLKELAEKLSEVEVSKAVAFSINRVAPMAKTKASSVIRSRYRIKKRDLDKNMGTDTARFKRLIGSIWSHGQPIPAHKFRYKQTKRGVRVTVLNKSSVIPGAFVQRMPKSGHVGIFARGRYDDKGFQFRKKRVKSYWRKKGSDLPITQLVTLSQGPMFANPQVIKPVIDTIETMMPVRLEHELNRILSGIR